MHGVWQELQRLDVQHVASDVDEHEEEAKSQLEEKRAARLETDRF